MQGRNPLSLHNLGQSNHPLMLEGDFSIYNDPLVAHTSSVTTSFDLDGVEGACCFSVVPVWRRAGLHRSQGN